MPSAENISTSLPSIFVKPVPVDSICLSTLVALSLYSSVTPASEPPGIQLANRLPTDVSPNLFHAAFKPFQANLAKPKGGNITENTSNNFSENGSFINVSTPLRNQLTSPSNLSLMRSIKDFSLNGSSTPNIRLSIGAPNCCHIPPCFLTLLWYSSRLIWLLSSLLASRYLLYSSASFFCLSSNADASASSAVSLYIAWATIRLWSNLLSDKPNSLSI